MSQTQSLLWLCVAAYGVHILEEFVFDWENRARNVLRLPVQWKDFYLTNALVIVLGIVAAEIAPVWPVVALAYPALMVINASFFHVVPFVFAGGRFSPGSRSSSANWQVRFQKFCGISGSPQQTYAEASLDGMIVDYVLEPGGKELDVRNVLNN